MHFNPHETFPGAGMLSPRTGLDLEAKKLVLALASMAMASASASRNSGLRLVLSRLVVSFIAMYLFHVLSQLLL